MPALHSPSLGINFLGHGIYRSSAWKSTKLMDGLLKKIKWLVILWLARRLPDCKLMTRSLGESLDRKTTWSEKIVIKLHLYSCEACERYLEQITFLKEAAHTHGDAVEASEFSTVELTAVSKQRMKAFARSNLGLAF